MPSLQSMNSAALVAAALGSGSGKPTPSNGISRFKSALSSDKEDQHWQNSSPLTEMSDHDFSSGTERRLTAGCSRPQRTNRRITSDQNSAMNRMRRPAAMARARDSGNAAHLSYDVAIDRSENQCSPPRRPSPRSFKAPLGNLGGGAQRLIRKKPHGTRVPQTLDDAGEADRMMWEWKNMGRGWDEIRHEWQRLTGIVPGTSTLSVRYIKLNENFARHGAAQDRELVRFKEEVEEELLQPLWGKVAEKMKAFSDHSEYNPKDLKKRYDALVRSGTAATKKGSKKRVKKQSVKKEIKRETDELSEIFPDASAGDDAVEMNLAGHSLEEISPCHSNTNAPKTIRDLTSPSHQRLLFLPGIQDLSDEETEPDPDVVLPPPGGNSVTIEDDMPHGEYHEVIPEPQPGLPFSEGPTSQLASSPFLRSLVAYLSDNEEDEIK